MAFELQSTLPNQGSLERAGVVGVHIEYDGSGDSGAIESIVLHATRQSFEQYERYEAPLHPVVDAELGNRLEEFGYRLLESFYLGWEIDEGSLGTITIDVEERRITINHGQRIESVEWETRVLS